MLGPMVSLSLISFWLAHELRVALSLCQPSKVMATWDYSPWCPDSPFGPLGKQLILGFSPG